MPSHDVGLPHRITLVPSSSLEGKVRRQARDHPGLPTDLGLIVADLNARPGGVPMTFSEPRGGGDWSLLVYARTYVVRLFLTQFRDAYIIASVNPLRIPDHHRLAEGYLRVQPAGWNLVCDFRQIPPGSNAHWDDLWGEWRRLAGELAAERGAPAVTAPQAAFLDTVDRMIDATEKIATEETRSTPPFPYRSVGSTTERRHGRHATYVFELVPGRQPGEGDFVQIRGEPEQRGQVTRIVGSSVTVRFDQPVDWDRIPRPGELEKTPSSVVYDKQREAVALLRQRQARNPNLLSVIVDHKVRPIRPSSATPAEDLDDDQLSAYRRALTVPDMLLVLGPPGTGKTRTISQIARTCTLERHERVLITSHSNRAVDNVLAKLPADIEAIRVGHEGSVTEEGLPYLLERRVTELRERILAATRRSMAAYGDIEIAAQWAGELDEHAGRLDAAIADCARGEGELARARRAAGGPFQVQVDRLTSELARLARRLLRNQKLARLLTRCRNWVDARAGVPVAGFLLALLIPVLVWGMETLRRRGDQLGDAEKRRADELGEAERRLEAVVRDDPAVRAARDRLAYAARRRTRCRAQALAAAHALRRVVSAVDAPPPVRDADGVEPTVTEQDLSRLRAWAGHELPLILGRKTLLAEWHADVSIATDQLHTELVRYADVIAATSIGAASRPELSDIDFDLAIVDEAGQIGVADALVPLVRAGRGVLVGDHKQLPPFLDSEVEAWGKGVGDPTVRELLAKSALEILVEKLPGSHIVPLTWQRRMPAAIADFVSASFYDNGLHTGVEREQRDPLFGAPFAFVDTSKLPERMRRERSGRAREAWGQSGYVNPAEADLLTELAVFYHRRGADWAVIVPYRAQLAKISADLAPRIGDAQLTRLNVGTVDSFQGGERDVILYGFTRSNPKGDVGFLKELRRLNVAFSRARRQLVLVGDMGTLTGARDREFGELARSLGAYPADRGEIRRYQDIEARLAGHAASTDTRTEKA
jgi:hypothetical protein